MEVTQSVWGLCKFRNTVTWKENCSVFIKTNPPVTMIVRLTRTIIFFECHGQPSIGTSLSRLRTALRFVSLSYTKLRPESVRLRYRLRLLPLACVTVALPKIKIQRGRHVAGTFVLLLFFYQLGERRL